MVPLKAIFALCPFRVKRAGLGFCDSRLTPVGLTCGSESLRFMRA